MGCLVCHSPATIHHVTGYADRMGRIPRSHQCVVPLCPKHHQIQWGTHTSVEALGHRGFFLKYQIDLKAWGDLLWRETLQLEGG